MKLWTRDADGRRDVSMSFVFGLVFVGMAAGMYAAGWGDAILQVFFAITGAIGIVMGLALTPRHP